MQHLSPSLVLFFTCIRIATSFSPIRAVWEARLHHQNRIPYVSQQPNMIISDELSSDITYNGISVSGFVDKGKNYAETYVFSTLFHTGRWKSITTITDNVSFAKKRLVNPVTVYSGLIDVIKYASVNSMGDWENALKGNEAWLSYGISSSELPAMAETAVKAGMKRVVFAVKVEDSESREGVAYESVCNVLAKGGVSYTIFKYNEIRKMGEAKFPFRIVRGVLPLPTEGQTLSSDDLMRVLVESIDLPNTFNNVYGIGPGSAIDTEILVYMKSQGWPERVQIGLLLGDVMEKIEKKYIDEAKNREEKAALGKTKSNASENNQMAGFFK